MKINSRMVVVCGLVFGAAGANWDSRKGGRHEHDRSAYHRQACGDVARATYDGGGRIDWERTRKRRSGSIHWLPDNH